MDALLTQPVDVMAATPNVGKKNTLSRAALEKTSKEFESVFMAQMLKPMWDGIETDGMFGGGTGEDVMRDMLVQEYGKAMVRNDKYGLSPAIMNEMIRMQNLANQTTVSGSRG